MPKNKKDYGFGNSELENNGFYPYNHVDDLINEKVEQHLKRTDNPHDVTIQQTKADKWFIHNIRVEYDENKPQIHLILLDMYGNELEDVGPIDLDISSYSDEQIAQIKTENKEYIDSLILDELNSEV